MENGNDFSNGYERGLKEARPVIELEQRVKSIGGRRKADEKEFLKWKEERRRAEIEDQLLEKNASGVTLEVINGRNVRRHARQFIVDSDLD